MTPSGVMIFRTNLNAFAGAAGTATRIIGTAGEGERNGEN
jgi:hypothetical protein